jgi:hypothetical protein
MFQKSLIFELFLTKLRGITFHKWKNLSTKEHGSATKSENLSSRAYETMNVVRLTFDSSLILFCSENLIIYTTWNWAE